MALNSILVAVDFGAGSTAIVERAFSIAPADSRVTLVHVVDDVPLASVSRNTYHLSDSEYHKLLARDAWRRFGNTIATTPRKSLRVHARVATGDPPTEIARIATAVEADVILVGVKQRGAIGRRTFASTATRVIRSAGRPVLAIPELLGQTAVPVAEEGQLAGAA
jgi:nucleotide-binding universal stress UspA family protein